MNRFYDISGDVSTQLAPWVLMEKGFKLKTALFVLLEPLSFYSDIAGGDIIVPSGFLSDLASIPQAAWSIFMSPDDPRIDLGSWVHDLLYRNKGTLTVNGVTKSLTRQQCDAILAYEAMPELGASKFQQNAVYYVLRLFGSFAWNKEN